MSKVHLSDIAFYVAPWVLLQVTSAQHNVPLGPPPVAASSTTPTSGAAPSAVSLSPAALSSDAIPFAAMPTFTDDPDSDNAPTSHPVVDYYFFFLAIFVIAIAALYWILRRKRKRLFANAATRQQRALAADLERWPHDGRDTRAGGYAHQPRTGRWYGLRPARAQEGLNERGEAPPAYVAKPAPTYSATGAMSASPPEWIEMSGKPPEYEGTRHA